MLSYLLNSALMTQNVLEEVLKYFEATVVSRASAAVGESEAGVKKALPKVVPVVLSCLIKLSEQPGGTDVLWTMTNDAQETGPEVLASEQVPARARRGQELVRSLLADSYANRVETIAVESGIGPKAVEALLGMVVPVMFYVIGRHVVERQLDVPQLGQWLSLQRMSITGLMLADAAAHTTPAAAYPPQRVMAPGRPESGAHTRQSAAVSSTAEARTSRQWLWPAVIIMGAVIMGYLLGQQREGGSFSQPTGVVAASLSNSYVPTSAEKGAYAATADARTPTAVPITTVSGRYDAATENYIYDTGQPVNITLADGNKQTVGANSTENKLYTFLTDSAMEVDSVNRTKGWINFDRVYFDPKKATLTDESILQLRNVAAIMKNYPAAHIKIGGYTDSTGNYMDNLKLSEARATSAMAALVDMGIPANRIEAKGYGVKHNVASNETPVGRSLNRRISLRVTRK
jgi:outer membrane protein OmpA-like peptidoglycan-associated protein